jgi:undecaprenyl phosphate N,N'-diacetylbacillosamine 1-phosphate transferase
VRAPSTSSESIPGVRRVDRPGSARLRLAVKRLFDVVAATIVLVLLAPLFAVIAAAIKIESPGLPLFFNDTVMGRDGRRFKFLKFRTMFPHAIDYADRPEVRPGSPLVTRVGNVLRRFKLDELPQFLNVLRGEMSLVGPRPMDPTRFAMASAFHRQRLLVRPGLTGWVQINGNIHWSWEERMDMDVWYLARWSLRLDARILGATVPTILFGERRQDRLPERIADQRYRVMWPGSGRHQRASSFDPVDKAVRM